MEKIVKELILDVMRDNNDSTVSAKQNDVDTRFLRVNIVSDVHPIEFSPLSTVMINACRPDGEKGGFIGEINTDGSLTVPITPWMLKVSGAVKCDVSIFDEGEKLTTMPFYINVEESLYDGEGIESSEDYGVLSSLMAEAQKIREAEEVRAEAEKSRAEAEEVRAFSEESRENAETVRETNEAARINAEESRDSAEGLREISEVARESAEEEREKAELSRAEAEKLREAAEALRVLSDSVRTTFVPSVSESGVLSWSNDKGLTNPEPVSIIPVRGTDYWTESDKSEIISQVLNALPSAEGGAF